MRETGAITHAVAGEELCLLPEKAIFWQRKKSLFVADLHLGKSGHFRKSGIPVSSLVHHEDLNRLSAVLAAWPVETIYLLGDLFHSFHNREWKQFMDWRMQYPKVNFHLVKGNHDILDDQLILDGNILLHHESLIVEPFFLSHKPVTNSENSYYQFYGHLHPGVRMNGKGLQSLSFPCFCFGVKSAVLPAFGGFTGYSNVQPSSCDAVFIVYNNLVKQIVHPGKT
ncbi:MAG TPA: ligase-associated DNA damage response endonuclease PdeM [Chitinophagales bacterium]|nr:ligase-associated DNA damage response endonuclease PdeM [Chitinophagales bacterium]